MKKICLLLSLLVLTQPVWSAFKDAGWGVRPMGMGGAFTAVANDTNANIYNPAGVAQPVAHEVSFMSSKLFTGLEGVSIGQNYLSYIYRYKDEVGNFGFYWSSLNAQSLYKEDVIAFTYGRFFTDVLMEVFDTESFDLLGGASLKYLSHGYTTDVRTADDPVFAGGSSKAAPTLDLGFMTLFPDSGISLGLALRNITSPDVGLKTPDKVPFETALGFAYFTDLMPVIGLPTFTFALDLVSRDKSLDYKMGFESWLLKGNICVRAGINPQEINFGLGHEFVFTIDKRLNIDYAFSLPTQVEKSSGSHRIAVSFRFP